MLHVQQHRSGHSTYTYSETCIINKYFFYCLPAHTSVGESNTIQMNGGNVWNTARDQDIHCTDFLVFDFTSNVKRSKWVKCRLQVRISSWLIFLKTSCIKALCTCMYFEFLFSLWLVYLTILMQLDVTWLVLRLNQQKWEDQSKLCIFLCYIV